MRKALYARIIITIGIYLASLVVTMAVAAWIWVICEPYGTLTFYHRNQPAVCDMYDLSYSLHWPVRMVNQAIIFGLPLAVSWLYWRKSSH